MIFDSLFLALQKAFSRTGLREKKRDAALWLHPVCKIVVVLAFSKQRADSLSSFRLRVCVRWQSLPRRWGC